MSMVNMSNIFEKLDDLKAVFRYGQKIIPILQSLIDFMRETVPLLENVNNSIADSTKQIPKASDSISDVTKSTELATTEILDIVDVISGSAMDIASKLKEIIENEEKKKAVYEKLSDMLRDNEEASALLEQFAGHDETLNTLKGIDPVLTEIQNNVFNITISLQVQDITSQQLASVNHLIGQVQSKLNSLVFDISNSDLKAEAARIEDQNDEKMTQTFNADARYVKDDGIQQNVDSIVKEEKNKTTQDEIDKLFS